MIHPMPEINAQLKQLRLSHIVDKLQQRNRESIERKLTYTEFFSYYYKMNFWVGKTISYGRA
ncbi:hypothetical protein LEWO105114_02515 [Legionella worsleiensis]|uniref:Uncharacterized protein n=1 Tax=Legionella worsleiensis TaxID=45076 RepID=A0A0W1AKL1_9GAMM|nr:hypothetical protein Lwor_0180 [Legionella worsleiensis]STY30915.1 Transposase and inactivated derivatives [Legionella worsleiensis]